MLAKGKQAPSFQLYDQNNNLISLEDFRGKKVVLYFYPKDNTPGCTKQACAFKDNFSKFQNMNCVIIGISKDSVRSHMNFTNKYELPFLLLSDPSTETIQAYDVWKEKKMYGKTYMGIIRSTYIIDEKGMIAETMEKVKPDSNPSDAIAYLEQM